MKRFLRTIPGKTITFISFVLSACIVIGCVAGVVLMIDGTGYSFYTYTEEELTDKLTEDHFISLGYSVIWDVFEEKTAKYIDGNFYCRISDSAGNVLWQTTDWTDHLSNIESFEYGIKRNAENDFTDIICKDRLIRPFDESWDTITLEMAMKERSSETTEFMILMQLIHVAYSLRYAVFGIGIAALLLAIASFIALMVSAGHRPDTEEIIPGPLYRIPFDLELAVCGAVLILLLLLGDSFRGWPMLGYIAVCGVTALCVCLGLCISAAVRIKLHTLISNTVIYRAFKLGLKIIIGLWHLLKRFAGFCLELIRNIPLVWKTGLGFVGIYLFEMIIAFSARDGWAVVGLTLEKMVLIPVGLYVAICLRKLQKGGAALARGDLSHITDTKGMFWDLKIHGENLNSIASGMAIAVEERTKSERMKTELITNVSHDIKTPLTSIINYAALIGEEPCENPKITEYADVLVRQSERMKRLIEDLVEASKASTGNLEVNLAPCDATTFVTQAAGEYEDKLNQAELTLITKHPEKDIRILADGRRMWRVFDNLMNNICKYAQSGTRVYLSLEQVGGNAVFTFKNTSREALDMTEEELMERFTRGDSSRNTEGNGLGLSIAKSMAELQNGSLQLSIDGDLFKAILSFPMV